LWDTKTHTQDKKKKKILPRRPFSGKKRLLPF